MDASVEIVTAAFGYEFVVMISGGSVSSGPIPAFASLGRHLCECWNQKTTRKQKFPVELGI